MLTVSPLPLLQFDVLWGELSGIEHLRIYGHVKGVPWREVGKQTEELLEKVRKSTLPTGCVSELPTPLSPLSLGCASHLSLGCTLSAAPLISVWAAPLIKCLLPVCTHR